MVCSYRIEKKLYQLLSRKYPDGVAQLKAKQKQEVIVCDDDEGDDNEFICIHLYRTSSNNLWKHQSANPRRNEPVLWVCNVVFSGAQWACPLLAQRWMSAVCNNIQNVLKAVYSGCCL